MKEKIIGKNYLRGRLGGPFGGAYHQEHSKPVMEALKKWLEEQINEHKIEENSGLGGPINYMLNHWQRLTQFLHREGAPIDNNICERILKRAILHRKNSLFFKTQNGANVGDIFLSLIHTTELHQENLDLLH